MRLSSNSQKSNSSQRSEDSLNNGDLQIQNYVKDFQREVQRKYEASPINKNYKFPKNTQNKNVSTKFSLESIQNIQFYDLHGQNISQFVQTERKANAQQCDVLASLIKQISRLDMQYVKQQLANKKSSMFKNLSNLVLEMQPVKRKKNTKTKSKFSARDVNFPTMHVKNNTARINSPFKNLQKTEALINFKKCRSNDSLTKLNLRKILGQNKNQVKYSKRKIKPLNSLNQKRRDNISMNNSKQKDLKLSKNIQSFIKIKSSINKKQQKKNCQSIVQKKDNYIDQRLKNKHHFNSSRQLKPFTPINQNSMMYMVKKKFLNQKPKKSKKSINKNQIQDIQKIAKTPLSTYRSKKAFSKQKKINY